MNFWIKDIRNRLQASDLWEKIEEYVSAGLTIVNKLQEIVYVAICFVFLNRLIMQLRLWQ